MGLMPLTYGILRGFANGMINHAFPGCLNCQR
ncbi:hypothetical protein Pla123a_17420 [Posidoniimonas polymericola]|uniref:Uncharacterized protein n=1 Tax=Posidoniimonas polymericola TaxID=2528002 RepID=A0A5C5YT83_9BACT|nr:hypothetical protein Pla123a_17420 [Posidoniimonas polymericola]